MNIEGAPKTQKLTKYDFGVLTEPVDSTFIGFKHESGKGDKIEPGTLKLYTMHHPAGGVLGGEFALDWASKEITGQVGAAIHREGYTLKGKLDNDANVTMVFKQKLSDKVTASVTSGMNLNGFTLNDVNPLPFGIALDMHL